MFVTKRIGNAPKKKLLSIYPTIWHQDPYGEIFQPEEVYKILSKPGDKYKFIFEPTKEIIGFVIGRPFSESPIPEAIDFLPIPDVTYLISDIAVVQKFRNYGLSKFLMQMIIANARLKGYYHFILRTHKSISNPALPLYKSLGFETRFDSKGNKVGAFAEQTRKDNRNPLDFRVFYFKEYRPKPSIEEALIDVGSAFTIDS